MTQTRSNIRLVIAGPPESDDYSRKLVELLARHDLQGRVELLGLVTEERKRELFANAMGVLYPPRDEDYGYVTLEAFHCAKPVITCTDSGGPLEFVSHQETGLICDPNPRALAEAIDTLAGDRALTERYGRQAFDCIHSLNLSWTHVVETLVS